MRCLRNLAISASVRAYFSLRKGQSNKWTLLSMMSGPWGLDPDSGSAPSAEAVRQHVAIGSAAGINDAFTKLRRSIVRVS